MYTTLEVSIRSAGLRAAILARQPDIVIPADDGVVWQLHQLHTDHVELRPLIEYFSDQRRCMLRSAAVQEFYRSRRNSESEFLPCGRWLQG